MENDRLYSPAQLAPILGVSESTLKRWVDAGHLRGVKSPGGHRKIALADLLAFLRARGRAVPSLEGLGVLAERTRASAAAPATATGLADLLLRGDTDVARTLLLDQVRAGQPLDEILDRLVAPCMAHVGMLWAQKRIGVYEEHRVTLCAWAILFELRGLLPAAGATAPIAVGGTPPGDPYLLPCLMAEMVLIDLGWRTINTGPDTPLASLCQAVEEHRPALVWLSITTRRLRPDFFDEYARLFETAESHGARVVLGGQGVTPRVQDRVVASAFGTRLAHLKAFASSAMR
jgi:excisionase family DNA binding protein